MVPRSAEECRVVPGRGGADIGEPVEQPRTVCGAEECRGVPSSAGKGWGRHWGGFKLLYYHCNTTKINRVEQPRTVCGAEECRVVPGRGGADIGEPLNYSTTGKKWQTLGCL